MKNNAWTPGSHPQKENQANPEVSGLKQVLFGNGVKVDFVQVQLILHHKTHLTNFATATCQQVCAENTASQLWHRKCKLSRGRA